MTPRCRYEALQLGSVPVYVWDYDIIVPYQELLNWNEVSPRHTTMHPGCGMECIWLATSSTAPSAHAHTSLRCKPYRHS